MDKYIEPSEEALKNWENAIQEQVEHIEWIKQKMLYPIKAYNKK